MNKLFMITMFLAVLAVFSQELKKAPSFRLENTEGKFVELDSLLVKGPVLVNFWASWCKPCKEELPEIDRISKEFSDKGLKVILITIDKPSFVTKAKSFLKTKGLDLELLKDCDLKVLKSFGGSDSVPFTFIIDTDKNITFRKKGQTSYDEMKKEVLKLIK
jgi:peroxiredoxin